MGEARMACIAAQGCAAADIGDSWLLAAHQRSPLIDPCGLKGVRSQSEQRTLIVVRMWPDRVARERLVPAVPQERRFTRSPIAKTSSSRPPALAPRRAEPLG